MNRIGIIAAMPQEFERLCLAFEHRRIERVGPRNFHRCVYGTTELVLVISSVGKVSAAATTALLVDRFGVDAVVMTGVAGGVGAEVGVGDIVLAESLVHHDLDLKGVLGFQRFAVPSLGVDRISTCRHLGEVGRTAAHAAVRDSEYRKAVCAISARDPQLHIGVIGSGDQFVDSPAQRAELVTAIPDLLAVEMEGAAVGQVCAEHGVPFVVARVISDTAQGEAPSDFTLFIENAAAVASEIFVREFVTRVAV